MVKMTKNESEDYILNHAHLQILTKAPAKFQKDLVKTVGGFAFTRYPVTKFQRNYSSHGFQLFVV